VIWGIVGVLYLMSGAGQEVMAAALAQSGGESPEMAGMAGMMAQLALWMAIFFVVLQLILGFVQWAKPNKVIPILFIILVVYGIGSAALGQMMAGQMEGAAAAQGPLWLTIGGYVVLVVELVLHIAGVRGASALDRIRMDAAQNY